VIGGLRRLLLAAGVATTLAAAPAAAQDLSQRFSIADVGDTTFTFAIGKTRWVKPRQRGVAVDARERDALVARFRVMAVRRGMATAMITGQTRRVTPAHTVIMTRPPERWYRNPRFWAGAAVGLVGGTFAGAQIR
jgi:hypothetical protein